MEPRMRTIIVFVGGKKIERRKKELFNKIVNQVTFNRQSFC